MDVALRAGAPMGEDRLRRVRNLETSSLATTFPFDAGLVSMGRGVLYGLTPHEHSLLILDPFDEARFTNGNTLVCAKAGAGKSAFVKITAARSLLAGVDYIIVDPEDEYRRLCERVGGQYVRLALGAGHCINPFDLPPTGEREAGYTDPVAEQAIAVEGLLQMALGDGEEGARLTPRERPVLLRAIKEAYARAGIAGTDPATWRRPAPVLDDLRRILLEVPAGTAARPVAEDLASRLEPYVAGGALDGFLNRPTNVDLGRRLVVFNIQALDGALHPLAIHIIAGFVWRQLRWRKARRRLRETMLVVDECWSLLKHERGGRFLEEMARRARKYGLALVTITQRPGDFLESAHGQAVLANATIKLLLKQDSSQIGAVGEAFGLNERERHALVNADPGTGLLFALEQRTYLEVVASPVEWEMATTAPRDIAALEGLDLEEDDPPAELAAGSLRRAG
jgi:conjugal transfer ATP-binding protein TraC